METYYYTVVETSSSGEQTETSLQSEPAPGTTSLDALAFADSILKRALDPQARTGPAPAKTVVNVWKTQPDPLLTADPDAIAQWPNPVAVWTDEE